MTEGEQDEPTRPLSVTPAGWYPVDGQLRWWDGWAWTEHRQALPPQGPPAAPPTANLRAPVYPQAPGYSPAPMHPQAPGLPAAVGRGWSNAAYPVLVTDARPKPVETTFAWVLTVLTLGYLLPWAIAATRGKSNSWAVGLVSFFAGWTLIGWVAALVMACTAHQVVAVRT